MTAGRKITGVIGALALAVTISVGHSRFAYANTDLGVLGGSTSDAIAVSDGQVAGNATTADSSTHAFSWTAAGSMVDLGALGGNYSRAFAISDGQVVGYAATAAGNRRAFSWTATGGMVDLGTFGGAESVALAVSNGQVVGWAALHRRTMGVRCNGLRRRRVRAR